MQIKNLLLATTLVALTACGGNKTSQNPAAEIPQVKTSDQLVMSTLWFQRSKEAKQIYHQLYQLAEAKMMQNLKKVRDKEPSVIVDIDETILDNSPYEARLIKNGEAYSPESWAKWVKEANAQLLPGAFEFLMKAQDAGVQVFYISNRSNELMEPTIENLQKRGLPFVDGEHVLLKNTDLPSKEERRDAVKRQTRVVLLVGDQLSDFSDRLTEEVMEVNPAVNPEMRDSLDQYFVLLPNPMYGSFENTIYPEGKTLTDAEKVEYRKKALDVRTAVKR